MKTNAKASLTRRLRAEESVCRKDARQHGKDALRFIEEKKFFLAVTKLIEAEVAQSEAEAMKRAVETVRGR